MEEKLESVSFPYEHKHVAFENMSHAAIAHLPWIYKMAFKSERQHPKECARDRERMKMELLAWIDADLSLPGRCSDAYAGRTCKRKRDRNFSPEIVSGLYTPAAL